MNTHHATQANRPAPLPDALAYTVAAVNRRRKRTPDRRPKGTPLVVDYAALLCSQER